jgi:TRAP-type C4-dicarboxylate transport system substrate-binding protein
VADNGYDQHAKYLSGFALFDKVGTFVASQRAWSRLDAAQKALRAAAADLQRYTVGTPARDEATLLTLCRSGVRVTPVSSDQLQGFQQAAKPTIDLLSEDPATSQILLDLEHGTRGSRHSADRPGARQRRRLCPSRPCRRSRTGPTSRP